MINELEMIGWHGIHKAVLQNATKLSFISGSTSAAGDELWGNIYGKDCLARIDKTSGSVTGWLVLDGILDRRRCMPIHSELRSLVFSLAGSKV